MYTFWDGGLTTCAFWSMSHGRSYHYLMMPNENEWRIGSGRSSVALSLMAESNVTHCLSQKDGDGGGGEEE